MRPAQGPDHYFVQGIAAERPDRDLSRPGAQDGPAAAPWTDRSWHGREGLGLVGGVDGDFAGRRNWRHDSHFADAASEWRPARGSLRRVRVAAVAGAAHVRAERDGVSRLRTHDQHDVPGTGRKYSGLHPRKDARMEAALR